MPVIKNLTHTCKLIRYTIVFDAGFVSLKVKVCQYVHVLPLHMCAKSLRVQRMKTPAQLHDDSWQALL